MKLMYVSIIAGNSIILKYKQLYRDYKSSLIVCFIKLWDFDIKKIKHLQALI